MTATIFLPRGIRNNNPGNIRLSKIKWQGQKITEQSDESFVQFTAAVYGLRALMKLLLTYYFKYGLDTVESIINRYAPPYENATDNYIYHVSKVLGVKQTEKINVATPEMLIKFTKAIVHHENGKPPRDMPFKWYADSFYEDAVKMALPNTDYS